MSSSAPWPTIFSGEGQLGEKQISNENDDAGYSSVFLRD